MKSSFEILFVNIELLVGISLVSVNLFSGILSYVIVGESPSPINKL